MPPCLDCEAANGRLYTALLALEQARTSLDQSAWWRARYIAKKGPEGTQAAVDKVGLDPFVLAAIDAAEAVLATPGAKEMREHEEDEYEVLEAAKAVARAWTAKYGKDGSGYSGSPDGSLDACVAVLVHEVQVLNGEAPRET